MMVLCSNGCGHGFKRLHRHFPERIGWLLGPSSWKNPWAGLRYALDNDAFSAWTNKTPWNEALWLKMLEKAHRLPEAPMWALCPDVVANRELTIEAFYKYFPTIRAAGFKTAFAVQDRMTAGDVPRDADLIFVGGSTAWKWNTLPIWARSFPRVHVGRVRQRKLTICHELKVESCDGTGWFREGQTGEPVRYLEAFLEGRLHAPAFDFYHHATNL